MRSEFKPFPCAICGEPVKLHGRPGRTFEFRRAVILPIPADFLIPTCVSCGEEHFTEGVLRKLNSILREDFLARQSHHFRELVVSLMERHDVSQKDIERACAVTASYLSHVLAGNRMASTMLTRLLEAFVACPAEFERHMADRPWSSSQSTGVGPAKPMNFYPLAKPPEYLKVADSVQGPPVSKKAPRPAK